MNFRHDKIRKSQGLGERIKRLRRRKRISLSKMEGLTKIRSRYISAIEKGEYDKLPGDIYVRGFLKTIAKTLNTDPERLIDLYQEEIKGKRESPTVLDRMRGIKETKLIISPKMLFIFLGIVAFLLVGGYFWYQVSGFAAAPKLEISKPEKDDFVTKSDEVVIEGISDPGTKVTVNDQTIKIDLEGKFREIIKLKSGVNQIIISASNKIGKEVTREFKILSKAPPKTAKVLGETHKSEIVLIIEVNPNPSWLDVKVDGKNIYSGVMLSKTFQEFIAKKEIVLTSGNAGSTHVYLNGKDLGVLGKDGELVKNIKYDLNEVLKIEEEKNE